MRKRIYIKIIAAFLLICIIVFCIVFPLTTSYAGTGPSFSISVPPAGQIYKVGDIVTLTMYGYGIKDMYAFEAALVFDPDKLQYSSSKVVLTGDGLPVSKLRDNNSRLLFGFTRMGKAAGDNGDLTLCEIKFKALAEGSTAVKLESVKIVRLDETSQIYSGNELSLQIGKDRVVSILPHEGLTVEVAAGVARGRVDPKILQETFDKALKDNKGVKAVEIIIPEKKEVNAYETILPASFFTAADTSKEIIINTASAKISIPGNMLDETNIAGADDVSITIAKAYLSKLEKDIRAQIGDRPVIELSLKVSGKPVQWTNQTSAVTVSVPYKPTAAELKDIEHITVWYLDGSGKPVSVPSGRYDTETGMVTFSINHFSSYAVVFVYKTFVDLKGYSWASKEICVLASKGIINGIGGNKYAPAENITRADFLALLVRTLGLNAKVDNNFSDVKPKDYFYNELGIAKKLGITSGIGNNLFDPRASITRQDMMTMTAKALKVAGRIDSTINTKIPGSFTDRAEIAPYAVESVAILVNTGLIKGSNNRINPLSNATRAEMAVLMYRIYNME